MKQIELVFAPRIRCLAALLVWLAAAGGCGHRSAPHPTVQIARVPPADAGGPERLDFIEGSVQGAKGGEQIVLYAHSGVWWVQPFADHPLTSIQPDGKWKNSTHLGTDYAALLVDSGFTPPPRMPTVPEVGNGVVAVAIVPGGASKPVAKKTIHFSGYDWIARSAGSDRGGEPNSYDPDNAWVDGSGYLHLRMANVNGKWSCAEVFLARSLGYGTYRFVVQDSAHLPPTAVAGLFTWDDIHSQDYRNELDIELSRWGDPKSKNAQYVVQPFYVAENVSRFIVPPGVVTHVFRWEPGKVSFESFQGAERSPTAKSFNEHVFTSGIPAPASETVHIDLYEYSHSKYQSLQPSEVVIEKFEYLP